MSAVYGAWLLAFAAIGFAWAYGQYRRPLPAAWTAWESVSNAVILAIMAAGALGAGYVMRAVATWETLSLGVGHVALIAAAIAVVVPAVRTLTRPARVADQSRAATVHPLKGGPAEAALPPRDPPKPGQHRKAA